ncbi:MAG: hypothetical protein Q9184_000281 [Pyrenodesmia sp. 2 TL-2023]
MTSWFDSSSTLSDQVEAEKHRAQHIYQPGRTHRPLIRLWNRIHGGWPYQQLEGGSSEIESSVGPHGIEAHFREHFLTCGENVLDFDRNPMVEYKDLVKIPGRQLPKQAGHIFGVLSEVCKVHWRGILRRTFSAVNAQDQAYVLLQLPCNDDSFNWLWGVMESVQMKGARPQLLAAPVIPGVIEVLANEQIPLPANFRKPDVLPHGILSRQVAFHCKDRVPYRDIISSTFSNPNRIIKDMVESFTLTACPWSVVDCEITYH